MEIASEIQAIMEEFRRVLECQCICFVPGCSDRDLSHPLLDILPEGSLPVVYTSTACDEEACARGIWQEELVHALCDLAIQSGQMQTLSAREPLVRHRGLRSIAALPLESPRGILGAFLLMDERAEHFGEGERRLLYACLSMRLPALERGLWKWTGSAPRTCLKPMVGESGDETGLSAEPEQFIRGEFVSMVGHELRSPLSVIKGYAGLLQAYGGAECGQLAPEQQRHYLEALVEQSDLLELLVNDLLDISRLQRGDLALHSDAVDVEALCRQVVRLGQLRADQRAPGRYHLECRFTLPLAPVLADPERLQQVLMNLLENAIKYSPEGGSIELAAHMPDGQNEHVIISVRDQGIGIPAQRMADLFQPFERLQRSATAHIAGMGLGLYLARRLVEAMGGNIELRSCEGSGTNVTIRLPALRLDERLATDAMVQAPIS